MQSLICLQMLSAVQLIDFMIRILVFSFLLSAVALTLAKPCETATFKAPNIVIIVADDLGWADVGFHSDRIPTPHIDRIAREGVELDHFYVLSLIHI